MAYDATWASRSGSRWIRRGAGSYLARYDAFLCFQAGRCQIVADDANAEARLRARLRSPPRPVGEAAFGVLRMTPAARHEQSIRTALEAIRRGDLYQVNLARRWATTYRGDPLRLWLEMRKRSPVPLGLYLDAGDHQLLGRSMERFLSWRPDAHGRGLLESRPIKGTVARTGSDDDADAATLRADPKERAEHAMIVDLMRNDLGRVAEVGSMQVARHLVVEPYRGLHHLVSTVQGRTRSGTSAVDVLEATFPPGSVTGTPKESAIRHIEELEPHPRGVYTGTYGYVDGKGGLELAVAIRTAVIRGCRVTYFAGGGIVEASHVARELRETELKARVFTDSVAALRET